MTVGRARHPKIAHFDRSRRPIPPGNREACGTFPRPAPAVMNRGPRPIRREPQPQPTSAAMSRSFSRTRGAYSSYWSPMRLRSSCSET
jgi:hypothetical protein